MNKKVMRFKCKKCKDIWTDLMPIYSNKKYEKEIYKQVCKGGCTCSGNVKVLDWGNVGNMQNKKGEIKKCEICDSLMLWDKKRGYFCNPQRCNAIYKRKLHYKQLEEQYNKGNPIGIREFNEAIDKCIDIVNQFTDAGWICPKFKVGQEIYFVSEHDESDKDLSRIFMGIDKGFVHTIGIDERTVWYNCRYESGLTFSHPEKDCGDCLFATHEEAERALSEGK